MSIIWYVIHNLLVIIALCGVAMFFGMMISGLWTTIIKGEDKW
jgi:hypothetical protein